MRRARLIADFLDLFVDDAARWVRLQEVAQRSELTVRTVARLLWRYPQLRAMAWLRFGSWARAADIPAVPGLVQRRITRLYGLEVAPGARIGGGLYVAHTHGTTIAVERMGRNVTVIANVTIGMRTTPAWPRIGDDVFIGAGARVLGGIDVGAHASIGANAVVVRDVRPHTTVVGIPAREVVRSPSRAVVTGVAAGRAGGGEQVLPHAPDPRDAPDPRGDT